MVHEAGTGVAGVIGIGTYVVERRVFGLVAGDDWLVVVHVGCQDDGFAGLLPYVAGKVVDLLVRSAVLPDLAVVKVEIGVVYHIVHSPCPYAAVDHVEGDGCVAAVVGGQGVDVLLSVVQFGREAVAQVNRVAPVVVVGCAPVVPHLVQVDAVEVNRLDRLVELAEDVVLPVGVVGVKDPQVGIAVIVAKIEVDLVGVTSVGKETPLWVDVGNLLVPLQAGIEHKVGHSCCVDVVRCGDEIANGAVGDWVAGPIVPGVIDGAVGARDDVLVTPHPVIELDSIDVIVFG